MSVITEITVLEGIDLENVPPCEIMFTFTKLMCPAPSEFRIYTYCTCGDKRIIFVCFFHMKQIDAGLAQCGLCHQVRYATSLL